MQTHQSRLHTLFRYVPHDVNGELIVTQAIAARARLNTRQVHSAHRELLQHGQ